MSSAMFPMTQRGAEKIREELNRLKTVERPRIIQAIADARAHGDLKENAEYHAAKEQQSFLEGRIAELDGKLANCHIIDVTKLNNEGKVIFGATVKLINLADDLEVCYQIVGDDEADYKESKISVNSPLARAIIGKFEGDSVEVQTPGGLVEYEVVQVQYI